MTAKRQKRKAKPKKSNRIAFDPSLSFRSEPVLPDGQRVKCDLTTRTYRADLKTINADERSIEAVIATEDRVKVVDWSRYEVIEEILRMDGLVMPAGDQVPMLDTHNRFSVQSQLGSTRQFRVEGGKLIARNHYSSSADSEHAWTLCREGHLTDNSVGYRVTNAVIIEAGKTAEVEGRKYTAAPTMALRIAMEWEVCENSVCPIGADPKAKTRKQSSPVDGHNFNRKESSMKKFKQWLTARGLDYDQLDETSRAALKKDFDAEVQRTDAEADAAEKTNGTRLAAPAPAANPAPADNQRTEEPPVETAVQQAIAAERTSQKQRIEAIRTEAEGLGIDETVVQRCIDDPEMTVEAARAEFLKAIKTRGTHGVAPGIIIPDRSVNGDRMVDAMLLRAGFEDTVLAETDGPRRAEQADQFRDMTALDLCRHALILEGRPVTGSREDVIRAALSTSTLPTVLGAIYNKSLMRGYNAAPETWRRWCNIGSAPDFKTITRCRLTGGGGFEKVSDGGDLNLGTVMEEKEQYNLETYGKKDRFGRQSIIDDDLSVLTRVAVRHGRRGKLQIARLAYAALLANANMDDGAALFVDGHSNLNTTKPLTKENIAYAIMMFKKQTDKDGQAINVIPRFLLVPVELEDSGLEYVTSELIVLAGDTDAVRGNKNTLKNKLEVVADPLMSDSTLTGYSTTSWYLTASPAEADTVEVGFLNGRQKPTVHMNPKASDMYIEFEGYIDVAAKPLDHRTVQKNTA